jgi:hypothetical protein
MAGGCLSGSVIESPQGLHSNAYRFSAKARLMICNVIDLPQRGQATSLLGVRSSLIRFLYARLRSPTLMWINISATGRRVGFAAAATRSRKGR